MFVSQDGTPANAEVANLTKSYASQGVRYMHHVELTVPQTLTKKENKAYYRIANHYKFIMQTFFDCFKYPRLILLEVSKSAFVLGSLTEGRGLGTKAKRGLWVCASVRACRS